MRRLLAAGLMLGIVGCAGVVRQPDLTRTYPKLEDARKALLRGEYQEAVKIYEEVLPGVGAKIERFWMYLDLADIYLDKLADPERALSLLDSAAAQLPSEKHPLMDEVHYRRGVAYELLGKTVDAAKEYEKVATQFPKGPWVEDALDGVERVFVKNFQDKVAKVGDVYISALELDEMIEKAPPMYRARFKTYEGKLDLLKRMIDEEIAVQEAIRLGLDTLPEVRRAVENQRRTAMGRVYRRVTVKGKAEPTEAEMRAYYNQHKDQFTIKGRVRIKRVVVKDSALALTLLDSARAGVPFDSLVVRHTVRESEKPRRGRVVIYQGDQANRELYDAIMAAQDSLLVLPGQEGTWLVVRVEEKRPPKAQTFKEVRDQIARTLRAEKEKELWDEIRKELREKYGARVLFDTTAKELPETLAVFAYPGVYLTKEEFDARVEEIPAMFRARYRSPQGALGLVNTMVDERVVVWDADLRKLFLKADVIKAVQEARRRALVRAFYEKEIKEKVSVDSSEITTYYNENKEKYRVGAKVTIRRIVVKDRARARELARMIKRGASFDSLAAESIIEGDRKSGGRTIVLENTKPENFRKAVLRMKEGQIKVVPWADSAWAVVKVLKYEPARYRSLEEVWELIERAIKAEKEKDRAYKLRDQLYEKYGVEIYLKKEEEEGKSQEGE